ncbi:unnamed protein product [Lactuca saligna]|uniref:Uncharacterized protein n=1 Tax=Lactuca saligna TaxID=75948 RepID=A0AA36E0P4_LACSI|nr:unnamed protein product [Lactuca saligna]
MKWENVLTTHQETMKMLTSSNAKVIEESSTTAQASENIITKAYEKTQQLKTKFKEFMAKFQTSSDKSIADMNKFIEGFRSYLKTEKESLSTLCVDIKLDNVDPNTTFTKHLTKLQNDLAAKNKIMDALDEQTQKMKVLSEKVKNATLNIAKLEEEKSLLKG